MKPANIGFPICRDKEREDEDDRTRSEDPVANVNFRLAHTAATRCSGRKFPKGAVLPYSGPRRSSSAGLEGRPAAFVPPFLGLRYGHSFMGQLHLDARLRLFLSVAASCHHSNFHLAVDAHSASSSTSFNALRNSP